MLVTVYIPTKNRLPLLKRALASVLEQDYPHIEIIVVDDGSTDGTVDYLRDMERQGAIRAIFHPHSLGACVARNAAIEVAHGEFITGLDDDDYFEPGRISAFVTAWHKQGGDVKLAGLFDCVHVITLCGELIRHAKSKISHEDLRTRNDVGSQVFAPAAHYREVGFFDPMMPAWQDWDLWLRMTRQFGCFMNINKGSYVADERSDTQRITLGGEERIRAAYERLTSKMDDLTFRERSHLIAALYGYPQIEPRLGEIIRLLHAGRLRASLRSTRRLAMRVWASLPQSLGIRGMKRL